MIPKFRVWDTRQKAYVLDRTSDWSPSERYFITLGGSVVKRGGGAVEKGQLVLEQSTGLRDKNGKEIYEGDIVRFEGGAAEGHRLGVIDCGDGSYFVDCTEHDDTKYYRLMDYLLEVIGNIHENPELMKEVEHGESR